MSKKEIPNWFHKSYIIVDNNNEWLSILYNATKKDLEDDIQDICERLRSDGKENTECYVYEITSGDPIKTFII